MNYADPQSGNFLFQDDGRLGLIDFGCIQHFTQEEWELTRLGYQTDEGGPEIVRELLRRACGATEADFNNEEYMALINESIGWMLEPVRHEGPFDYGDEAHFRRGLEVFGRLVARRYTRSHPMYVYWHRSVFGMKALLYRLGAQVDLKTLPITAWWRLSSDG